MVSNLYSFFQPNSSYHDYHRPNNPLRAYRSDKNRIYAAKEFNKILNIAVEEALFASRKTKEKKLSKQLTKTPLRDRPAITITLTS
jgi:hypothetical protein